MGSFLSSLEVESGLLVLVLGSVVVGLSCDSVGLSDSVVGLVSVAVEGSGLGFGSSFPLSSFFFLSDFFDLVGLLFARELAISVAVSRGNGVFGSTFLTTRNEARTVFPPGNQSKIVYSGKR